MDDALADLARHHHIQPDYKGLQGERRVAPPETLRALLGAMGVNVGSPRDIKAELAAVRTKRAADAQGLPPYLVCPPDKAPKLELKAQWRCLLEDGTEKEGRGPLPPLPVGRHRLTSEGRTCWLLSAPPSLPLPDPAWGVTLPLYGLRGGAQGGLATYADLAVAVQGLARHGASFVGLNPVHAGFETDPALISPYSPSHRRRLAAAYLELEGEAAQEAGDLIDYGAARGERRRAVRAAFDAHGQDAAFETYLANEGESLRLFATYEALADLHGATWEHWPEEFQSAEAPAVRAFAKDASTEIRFHAWMQFLADRQLSRAAQIAREAGMSRGLYLDLAVGTHPFGAETWSEPASFAPGVSLGAPPDAFSPDGQIWDLAPFAPQNLIETGFEPLAATLRAQLRHAGMLRIDHILGFERAFWVPRTGAPGTYVSMPKDAMLAVARIEAVRAGAVLVGEDLGNIPDGLRADLSESGILGCEVAQFMPNKPATAYRKAALASFGTHDLPTWRGWQAARDISVREDVTGLPGEAAEQGRQERADDIAALTDLAGGTEVDDLTRFLASVDSRLVALQIEDLLDMEDQPNLPGTVQEYPNWRRRLPCGAEHFAEDQRLARAGKIIRASGR